jgi:hypothetical protein
MSKFLGHHYANWANDKFFTGSKKKFGHCIHAEVYLIQCYVIKFVSDLLQAGGILQIF